MKLPKRDLKPELHFLQSLLSKPDIFTLSQVELKPPSSKKCSTRKEVNYKETSGDSTSSVEYPVEGRHTDDESEDKVSDSGNRMPIFVQQDILPVYNSLRMLHDLLWTEVSFMQTTCARNHNFHNNLCNEPHIC